MSLVAAGVTYRIGTRALVDDVSFALVPGEVLAVVGPNGAGKSTLLRLLAGDLRPQSGAVLLDGRELLRWSPGELSRRRAVLPQQTILQFAFRAREVVAMGRAPYSGARSSGGARFGATVDAEIVAACLAETDAATLADRSYPSLSGGEQARVTLARILAQDTPLLLLDEPTAALDVRHQRLVMELARDVAAGGGSVLAIVHDLNLAAEWADRVAILSRGRLAALGPVATAMDPALLSAVFECPLAVVPNPLSGRPLVLAAQEHARPHHEATPSASHLVRIA